MKYKNDCLDQLKKGEVWVGNTLTKDFEFERNSKFKLMKTIRLGEQAYDIHGKLISNNYCLPLIINESESELYDNIMYNNI